MAAAKNPQAGLLSLREGDLVEVTWSDAWHDESNAAAPFRDEWSVRTVGWFLSLGKHTVHLGGEAHDADGTHRCVSHLPRKMVTAVRVVERAR